MSGARPNFFLIGAPKCGTTALSEYLRSHPQICFSIPKEPYHFCIDLPGYCPNWTDSEYMSRCFGHCTKDARAIGEGTVFYLFSEQAVPRILDFSPGSRFVVMLRNPIDLARSFHSHLLYPDCSEDVADFETAWRLQALRRLGQRLPPTCREPRLLQYREVAALGAQIRRLLERVQRDRVLFVFHEDFADRTAETYSRVVEFLGVGNDGRTVFPRINVAESYRFRPLARLTQRPPRVVVRSAQWLKRRLRVERLGVLRALRRLNSSTEFREALSIPFRRELIDSFEPDIRLVEEICERRLDHWRDELQVGLESARR